MKYIFLIWQDVDLRTNGWIFQCASEKLEIFFQNPELEKMFFEMLGMEPNYGKINYYLLLDEMF